MKSNVHMFERCLPYIGELSDRDLVLLDLVWRCEKIHKVKNWYIFANEDIAMILGVRSHPKLHIFINQRFKRLLHSAKVKGDEIWIRWNPIILQQNGGEPRSVILEIKDDLATIISQHITAQMPANGLTKPPDPQTTKKLLKYINKVNA